MIIWNGKKLPCLYVFIYKLMRDKSKNRVYISYSCIKELLKRRLYKVPKIYYFIILKEMEELGMIKKIENKPNIYYELIGKDIHKLLNQYNSFI